jgi:hypothetical protein
LIGYRRLPSEDDPAAILVQADEIKARYTAIFKV